MILCLDLETTGLDEQRCSLVEIGACWLHSGEQFFRACRPLPTADIEDGALKVNGWTRERLASMELLPEEQAVIEFLGWVRGNGVGVLKERVQIAGWNAHFDFRHICAAMDRAGIEGPHRLFRHRLIDVHSVLAVDRMETSLEMKGSPRIGTTGFEFFGDEIRNCDDASQILGLPEEAKPHNALAGARQVRAMLRRILGDMGALP